MPTSAVAHDPSTVVVGSVRVPVLNVNPANVNRFAVIAVSEALAMAVDMARASSSNATLSTPALSIENSTDLIAVPMKVCTSSVPSTSLRTACMVKASNTVLVSFRVKFCW